MKIDKILQQVVDYNDFDRYINKHFPQFNNKFESAPCQEWSNDSEYSFHNHTLLSKEGFDDLIKEVETYNEKSHYIVGDLITYLTQKGVFELGKVTIKVGW
jgi:hypothetical protein